MKFKIYREHGALNSQPIFDSFSRGLRTLGYEEVQYGEDISVIWSVLWKGRMKSNQAVYNHARIHGKRIMIVEVGNLRRNYTWRISLDNINGLGNFGNVDNLDADRPKKLGVELKQPLIRRNSEILICSQLPESLQWEGMPTMERWINETIKQIQSHSSRRILVRPHPRHVIREKIVGATVITPRKLPNTYDDFDINYNYHCVVNFNSGPAVQAAIAGAPIICDKSSLAYPVSSTLENIENISLPDREEWFLKLCHTEWTVDEIAKGIPIERILKQIDDKSI